MKNIKQNLIKVFAIYLSLFGIYFNIKAQSQNNTIEITQDFEIGKTYRFEIQRGKSDSRKPETKNLKSSTDVEFKVIRKKGLFKECSWKYGSTNMIGINPKQIDEYSKKLMNIHEGIEIKFLIDEYGVVQEITNHNENKKSLEKAFKFIFNNAQNKLTSEEIEKTMTGLRPTFETSDILVNNYCPELSVAFSMFGETVTLDTTYNTTSELPNPYGGRDFPTDVITKIENSTNNTAIISVKQLIPSNELNSIMRETFHEIANTVGKSFNEKEVPQFNMQVDITYNYDYVNKVMSKIYSEKSIESEGVFQQQTISVILK